MLVATAIAGLVTALLVRGWQRTQLRHDFVDRAGAVEGHPRTMQGYSTLVNRTSIAGLLFGDPTYESIWLYPGTYDDEYLARLHALFPETEVTDYDDGS